MTKDGRPRDRRIKLNIPETDTATVAKMSPKMDYVVVATTTAEIIVLDYESLEEVFRAKLGEDASSVLFLKHGDQFLVGCYRGDSYLFARNRSEGKPNAPGR